jgi:hypothetical protein
MEALFLLQTLPNICRLSVEAGYSTCTRRVVEGDEKGTRCPRVRLCLHVTGGGPRNRDPVLGFGGWTQALARVLYSQVFQNATKRQPNQIWRCQNDCFVDDDDDAQGAAPQQTLITVTSDCLHF